MRMLVTLSLVSGCFGGLDNDPLEPGTTELYGAITSPLSDQAWVSIVGRPDLSSSIEADGTFRIGGVPSGELSVAISNGIDQAAVTTVTAYQARPLEVRFDLRPAVRISGRVLLEEAYDDGTLRSVRVEGLPIEITTDADGHFVVPALFAGCHAISAEHQGFVANRQEICGEEGETIAINHQLRSSAPHRSAMCAPCGVHSDCESGLLCIAHHGESVCARTCVDTHECPSGFECQDVDGGRACLARASCEAFRDTWHDTHCTGADDCGLVGIDDGVCGADGLCTVSCELDQHCPETLACHAPVCG